MARKKLKTNKGVPGLNLGDAENAMLEGENSDEKINELAGNYLSAKDYTEKVDRHAMMK